jgi:hypothetical protein
VDCSLQLVSTSKGNVSRSFIPNGSVVTALACHQRFVAAGTLNSEILVWIQSSPSSSHLTRLRRISAVLKGTVLKLRFVPNTAFLLASCSRGSALLYNYADDNLLRVFNAPNDEQAISDVPSHKTGGDVHRRPHSYPAALSQQFNHLLVLYQRAAPGRP